jgi:hypothetical protein
MTSRKTIVLVCKVSMMFGTSIYAGMDFGQLLFMPHKASGILDHGNVFTPDQNVVLLHFTPITRYQYHIRLQNLRQGVRTRP